jgi:hypothetical protein
LAASFAAPALSNRASFARTCGFRIQGAGRRFQGSVFRVQGSVFRVQGSGFRVPGAELLTPPHCAPPMFPAPPHPPVSGHARRPASGQIGPSQDRQARLRTDRLASGQICPPRCRYARLGAFRPASGETGPAQCPERPRRCHQTNAARDPENLSPAIVYKKGMKSNFLATKFTTRILQYF